MLALFFQSGLDYTPLQSGLAVTPFALGSAVTAVLAGRLVERRGRALTVLALAVVDRRRDLRDGDAPGSPAGGPNPPARRSSGPRRG